MINNTAAKLQQPHRKTVRKQPKHRKAKMPLDQSNFVEMSAMVMKYLEKTLAGKDQKLIKNTKLLTRLVNKVVANYLKNYPVATLSAAGIVGMAIALVITKAELFLPAKPTLFESVKHKISDTTDDSMDFLSEAIDFVINEIKDYSADAYDEIVDHYIKKYPLQSVGVFVGLGILTAWLLRK